MASTDTERPVLRLRVPSIRDYGAPRWFERLPAWAGIGGLLVLLILLTLILRIDYVGGELWYDEANSIGIATHSLSQIPGILWHGGGAPLYFVLLHVWMSMVGDSEGAVHMLSVLFAAVSVPLAMWLGWSLYGRRVGLMLATLMAFDAYLTKYAEEARPYELLALIALPATAAFLHAFVYRRRRGWLPAFAICLALLVYTDAWGFFYWAATAIGVAFVWWRADHADRAGLLRDALLAFGAAFIVFIPWLPTLLHQLSSATAPSHYAPLLGANPLRNTLGSDRVTATLAIAVVAGCLPLLAGVDKRGRDATAVWAMAVLAAGIGVLALVATLFGPALAGRYMAPIVAPVLVIAAIGCARSGILGLVLLLIGCSFLADPSSFISGQKSDMREVAARLGPHLRAGDMVLVTQPEQVPLTWYYFGRGLRYTTALGPDRHPTYMDWSGAQSRLQKANPESVVDRLVGELRPGQRLLVIRPLTEGADAWKPPWSELVRLRSAQLSALVAADRQLAPLPWVFLFYRSSCCIASSALIYTKR